MVWQEPSTVTIGAHSHSFAHSRTSVDDYAKCQSADNPLRLGFLAIGINVSLMIVKIGVCRSQIAALSGSSLLLAADCD